MFPQLLRALPKSGGWMDTVKKILAFIELAMAFKFLSNADMVEHWGLLKREVFIGIWSLIALGLALYLLGVFDKRYSFAGMAAIRNGEQLPMRKILGVLVLLFAAYLVQGCVENDGSHNMPLLSGFAPPLSYSIYAGGNSKTGVRPDVINDYGKALQLAREQHKPLLIDFTGWACVNCRRMEEQVWQKPEVAALIKDRFILVSLYVDDRQKLAAEKQFSYKGADGTQKDIRTVGDKWAAFQSENFGQATQPLYAILNPDEKLMNNPVGYTPKEDEYKAWLECGLAAAGYTSGTGVQVAKAPAGLP
jgi:thioredoxin-related protein